MTSDSIFEVSFEFHVGHCIISCTVALGVVCNPIPRDITPWIVPVVPVDPLANCVPLKRPTLVTESNCAVIRFCVEIPETVPVIAVLADIVIKPEPR